jgi:hypothetical protein
MSATRRELPSWEVVDAAGFRRPPRTLGGCVGVHGTALRLLPMLALMRPGGANVPVGQANRPAHPGWWAMGRT